MFTFIQLERNSLRNRVNFCLSNIRLVPGLILIENVKYQAIEKVSTTRLAIAYIRGIAKCMKLDIKASNWIGSSAKQ